MRRYAWVGVILLAAGPAAVAQQVTVYNNTVTGTGSFLNGGTADQAGNLITRLVMDDLTFQAGSAGLAVNNIVFAVQNSNAVTVAARPRLRFWNADGVGGGPGTYFSNVGFTFNAIAFAPGASAFQFNPGPTFVIPAAERLWFGIVFDNNVGATGATLAQMDNLGVVLFDPPNVGSSTDNMFSTTAAGSFFLTNNPAGSLFNFGGTPAANVFWSVSVPEPSSMALVGVAVGGGLWRKLRRKA